MNHHDSHFSYSFKDFVPLLAIVSVIIVLVITKQTITHDWKWRSIMNDFMGFFFVIFGLFKMFNLQAFSMAFAKYDLIAGQCTYYGYIYPFIELGLGIMYLCRLFLPITNAATLLIMLVSAAGVAHELMKGNRLLCACLGTVFKLPMTYVTLAEDLLMAAMAAIMLLF